MPGDQGSASWLRANVAGPFRDASHVVGDMQRTHVPTTITPSVDPSLRYVLPVPRGWDSVWGRGSSIDAGQPEVIGLFAPNPVRPGPRLTVSVTRLRWDVDPVLWVAHGWQTEGWEVAVAGPLPPRWHPRFEVGALRTKAGEVEVRRTVGFIDDGRLLRVDTGAPARVWTRVHDLVWPCGALMSLARPTHRREVEPSVRHESSPVVFELPSSWWATLATPAWPGAVRWAIQPIDGAARSIVMRLDATPWPPCRFESVEARQERARRDLSSHGITTTGPVVRLPSGSASGSPGLRGIYRAMAHHRERELEVRFAHRDLRSWSIDYMVITEAPPRYAVDCMRAARALEIAVASTRIMPKENTRAA